MNTKNLSRFGAFMLVLVLAVTSCKPSTTFKITGTLDGIEDGSKVILMSMSNRTLTDTAVVANGTFTFTGSVEEPSMYYLMVDGKRMSTLSFYNENAKITIKGHADTLNKAVIEGSKIQDEANLYSERVKALSEKFKVNELRTEMYSRGAQGVVTEERKKEIEAILDTYTLESEQLTIDYIKEFPKANFSVILVGRATSGKSAAIVEEYINMLDPKLAQLPSVVKMRETVTEMKKTEVSMDSFIPNASNLTYGVDNTFAGKDHKNVIYLAVMTNDNVCAITADGKVLVVSPTGAKVAEFKSVLNSKPSVIAVDKADNIYVLGTIVEKKTVESRGRSMQVETPTGVECVVLNSKGVKVRDLKLEGLITATGVRVSENNILVADTRGRLINIYDLETGAKKSAIEKLRTCCGILDFGVRNNNEVLVANLGAFRVNGYDFTGAPTIAFGQRGTGIDEFHGCCNPVSVAFLSNGGIVSVEKDPTRIKVYSKEGAKKIEGIDELVKGCAYIPMIVDSKDNVYLASKTDGIVKCVSVK
ncbi:MAG: hypothetical protein CVU10_03520 [Bacteroidetes bacterium HGW-Bacteroidetes-5]|nr:MAG: hypothetical protein CVU10_03520 [Bacteroidetes bacterium HGW-Bacteroidetes-5]